MVEYQIIRKYEEDIDEKVIKKRVRDHLTKDVIHIKVEDITYDRCLKDIEDEFIEIIGDEVTICQTNDIDLNSYPKVVRVLNYIWNKYGVCI